MSEKILDAEFRIRVPKQLRDQAIIACRLSGVNVSYVVRAFLEHMVIGDGQPFPMTFTAIDPKLPLGETNVPE